MRKLNLFRAALIILLVARTANNLVGFGLLEDASFLSLIVGLLYLLSIVGVIIRKRVTLFLIVGLVTFDIVFGLMNVERVNLAGVLTGNLTLLILAVCDIQNYFLKSAHHRDTVELRPLGINNISRLALFLSVISLLLSFVLKIKYLSSIIFLYASGFAVLGTILSLVAIKKSEEYEEGGRTMGYFSLLLSANLIVLYIFG